MSLQILQDKCYEKLNKLGLSNEKYNARLAKEFSIFKSQDVDHKIGLFEYFKNCVNYSKENGKVKNTPHLLTLFILGVTDEDPVLLNMDLIKTKSQDFPDIDMDFEDSKRDLVKDYLVKKYGHENVANIIAFNTIKAKSSIKDVSRIENISLEEVEEVTKTMDDEDTLEKSYKTNSALKSFFDKYEDRKLFDMCRKIEGNVRQATKHPAGIVIAPFSLTEIVGLQLAKENSKQEREVVTCFEEGESRELSKLGLIKFDVLAVNALTVIRDTVNLIKKSKGINIDIDNIGFYDKEIIKLFHDARTIGIFQFEREWIRNLLTKIKISSFEDISAVNALNRPGPLDAHMETKFWKVKNGIEKATYLHPKLIPILEATYGIICYQESIIRIAIELAGWSPDDADTFRSIVSKGKTDLAKGINLFAKYEKLFIDDCIKNGIAGRINVIKIISNDSEIPVTAKDIKILEQRTEMGELIKKISCNIEVSDEIFSQIKTFARYGFNKAHSVSYGFVAYQCMFLKKYHTKEFMAMLMSNTPNAENPKTKENKYIDYLFEARRLGINVLPPDINKSEIDATIENDGIRSGLGFIKGLGKKAIPEIIQKRPFKNFSRFLDQISGENVNKTAVIALIHSGACDEFLTKKDDIKERFDMINEYLKRKKSKEKVIGNLTKAIEEESLVCGGEIFHSEFSTINLDEINSKLNVDDKVVSFDKIDIINVGTSIRIMGRVEKLFIKRGEKTVGFLHIKNGRLIKSFMIWKEGINKIDKNEELKQFLSVDSIISIKIKRNKDYNDKKSFIADIDTLIKIK